MLKAKVLGAVVALGVSSLAYANTGTAGAGFYVGGNVGYGKADYGSDVKDSINSTFQDSAAFLNAMGVPASASSSSDEGGVAGRAFVGYQFNEYVGVETGFTQFSNNDYKANLNAGSASGGVDVTLKTWAWDVMAKGILPFSVMTGSCNPFSVYAEAGAAYVNANADVSGSATSDNGDSPFFDSDSKTENQVRPIVGAGISYNVMKNLSIDVAYTHIFGEDSNDELETPNTDYVGLGVTYHFA